MTALSSSLVSRLGGIVALLIGAAGCGGMQLEARPAPTISPSVTASGRPVYFGTVFPLKTAATEPSFIYERRVDEHGGALVSTHITREPSGAIAIAESATHSADYALSEYTLHGNQLGQAGTIRVDRDQVTFHFVDGTGERAHVERQTGAVVVGPTLVGTIVRHLDALRAGEVVDVRLAVLDRLETIGFELEAALAQPGETRVRMKPSSFVIGLIVDPLYFTFESATGRLVRMEGRVPPKVRAGGSWDDFDARVEYRYIADVYR
jgi:hypothetical protein